MGRLLNVVNQLHRRTARDYLAPHGGRQGPLLRSRTGFDRDYWDGDRRYGYGGYRYDGRWNVVAQQLVEHYTLPTERADSRRRLRRGVSAARVHAAAPRRDVTGFDMSEYGLATAKEEVRPHLFRHDARDPFPFGDKHFDLVISVNALHNLPPRTSSAALARSSASAANKFIVVESFRTPEELFNLQCWALTCETFFRPESWNWLFDLAGYTGDYEFIYFEPPECWSGHSVTGRPFRST